MPYLSKDNLEELNHALANGGPTSSLPLKPIAQHSEFRVYRVSQISSLIHNALQSSYRDNVYGVRYIVNNIGEMWLVPDARSVNGFAAFGETENDVFAAGTFWFSEDYKSITQIENTSEFASLAYPLYLLWNHAADYLSVEFDVYVGDQHFKGRQKELEVLFADPTLNEANVEPDFRVVRASKGFISSPTSAFRKTINKNDAFFKCTIYSVVENASAVENAPAASNI